MKTSSSQVIDAFKKHKCCVLIPTYNNASTIAEVIKGVLCYCQDVYVVNDGSTDDTAHIIYQFGSTIHSISYPDNKGKGSALLLGMRTAYQDGFEYVVTIDSDGQHYPSDLPVFIEKLGQHPKSVMIGARKLDQTNINGSSSFANKFSNFWFNVETGVKVQDTQSGYRLYPLKPINNMKFYSTKYEFEIEVIVRLSWKAYEVLSVPIDVFYPSREQRISHFRPFKDFLRISVLNTVLVFFALVYFLPRKITRDYKKKKIKQIIKEDILGSNTPAPVVAVSIGFGVFMGIVPIWGYQLAVGFLIAHLVKLRKAIFFVFANISLPPMIPLILYLSYVTGGYVLGGETWSVSFDGISLASLNLKQYLVGSIVFATLMGLFFGLGSYVFLLLTNRKRRHK